MKKGSKKWKKEGKSGEDWHKIKFFLSILYVKNYFFFIIKKNWVLYKINYLVIFTSILSCEMIGLNIFLYFQKLIFFLSFLSLMIPQGIFFTNFSFRENWRNWRFKDLYSFAFTSLRDLKNFSNTFIYNLKGVTGYVRKLNWVCMLL